MGTLKPQSNTVIGTLAVDGWAVTFGTARRGLGGLLLFDVARTVITFALSRVDGALTTSGE